MKSFGIRGKIFQHPGPGGWHFVYISKDISQKIKGSKKGSAFVRVKATIGKTSWTTALFPSKDGPYLLAVKADVRKKEALEQGDAVSVACILI